MKFYSEILDTFFDSSEDLISAEESYSKKKTRKKTPLNSDKHVETSDVPAVEEPSRKELADKIEQADAKLKAAYASYSEAKVKAEEISKAYLKEIDALLDDAKRNVQLAEKEKYEAIKAFNDSYGAYRVTYTGAQAADDMVKAFNNLDAIAAKVFLDILGI